MFFNENDEAEDGSDATATDTPADTTEGSEDAETAAPAPEDEQAE